MFRPRREFLPLSLGAASAGLSQHMAADDHVHSAIGSECVLFTALGKDMNSVADTPLVPKFVFTTYLITRIRVANASISLTTAAGGIYPSAAKAGTPLVAAGQAYAALTGPTLGLDLTLTAAALSGLSDLTLFWALTTAQGAAATADLRVIGIPLS